MARRLDDKEIERALVKNGQELLKVERRNSRTYITVKCKFGHITEKIYQGKNKIFGCRGCQKENNRKWNRSDIIKYIEKENYKFVGFIEFNYYASRIIIKCPNEHKEYEVLFGNFYRGKRCECCTRTKYTKEKIISYVENEGYKFIEFKSFDKIKSIILIQCNKKHDPYEVEFRKFAEGIRCPICNESKGEKEVSRILEDLQIQYEKQYKFNDCKCKRALPFDFYLPQYNCCIEFDGKQHYEIIECWGGIDKLIDTVIRDTVKNEYCKKNDIKLIRIKYEDFKNIQNILIKKLNLK